MILQPLGAAILTTVFGAIGTLSCALLLFSPRLFLRFMIRLGQTQKPIRASDRALALLWMLISGGFVYSGLSSIMTRLRQP
jgi:hypothetical protein